MSLSGFTLFRHPPRGWQMSTRLRGEDGWEVRIIPDDQAQAILQSIDDLLVALGTPARPPSPPGRDPRNPLGIRRASRQRIHLD